ncbi:hypothetical protein [Neorhizobium sp. JUb45]|uniref:hypothetical protein n=1 Tax=Neorhizobium sp. JUb45 TaxID=2485113 RepID=UPI00104F1776|nr:hypothetical protein [Neorhizobium sp. JUb45]TCR04076.1 hypothetical protein EDF70_102172 [Neorhizobium sp. JUb45]
MKLMHEDQIPGFVERVAAACCDITAVGGGYLIGDSDLSDEDYEVAAPKLEQIKADLGRRDHLLQQIVDYLVSIGRVYPPRVVH